MTNNKQDLWKYVKDTFDTDPNPLEIYTTKQWNFRTQQEEMITIWIVRLFEKNEDRKEIIYYVLREKERLRWSSAPPNRAELRLNETLFKNLKKMPDKDALELQLKIMKQ